MALQLLAFFKAPDEETDCVDEQTPGQVAIASYKCYNTLINLYIYIYYMNLMQENVGDHFRSQTSFKAPFKYLVGGTKRSERRLLSPKSMAWTVFSLQTGLLPKASGLS